MFEKPEMALSGRESERFSRKIKIGEVKKVHQNNIVHKEKEREGPK